MLHGSEVSMRTNIRPCSLGRALDGSKHLIFHTLVSVLQKSKNSMKENNCRQVLSKGSRGEERLFSFNAIYHMLTKAFSAATFTKTGLTEVEQK